MSKGNEGFGSRIIGHEAHEKAVRDQAGGAHVFGTRVRGAITGDGPVAQAKRASEFGVRTTEFAHGSDTEGKPSDGLSIEQLRNTLAENPTFFDSLYEVELAREDGARPDALAIFYEVERGIKGQGRQEVMQEIKALLGQKGVDAEAEGNLVSARVQQMSEQATREAENKELEDLPRLKMLKERQDNLAIVRENPQAQGVGLTSEAQVSRIASDNGTPLPGQETTGVTGKVPTKPDGDINPETQQPGARLGVPKADASTSDSTSTTKDDSSSKDDSTTDQEVDFETYTKDELTDYLGDNAENVKGTGANGAVLKADLVKAAKKQQKAEGK